MKVFFRKYAALFLIASLFFTFGLLRLNDLSFYNDCTRYLIWGSSIAQGKGFVDDSQPAAKYYVVNAPLFSVILAPALVLFPLSVTAAKVWALLLGVIALLLFYKWLRIQFDRIPALITVIIFAFNPLTLIFSTEILSETSFLCAILSVFILLEIQNNVKNPRITRFSLIFILAFIMLLREVGIAVVASAILFLLLKKQWKLAGITTLFTVIVFAAWTYRNLVIAGVSEASQSPNFAFIFHHFVTSPDTSFIREFSERIILNYRYYSVGLNGMMLYYIPFNLIVHPSGIFIYMVSFLNGIRNYAVFIFVPAILSGIILDLRRSNHSPLRLLFILTYLCIILIYPVQDIRFLFPLLPFAIYYISFLFVSFYAKQIHPAARNIIIATVLAAAFFPNLLSIFEILRTNYSYRTDPVNFAQQSDGTSVNYSYFSTPWEILGIFMDQNIPAGTIIATPKKEIVPFSPKHKFLEINRAVPLPQFEALLRNTNVEYILAPTAMDSILEYQSIMDESKRFRFKWIKSINRLNLLQVESKLENPQYDPKKSETELNRDRSIDLLRYGRKCILNEQYTEALEAFGKLNSRFPQNPYIRYQLLIIYTFRQDSAMSVDILQNLYSSPLAASYIGPAQILFNAMNAVIQAQAATMPEVRSELFSNAGRLYWNLGYPQQAYRIIQCSVCSGPEYFSGLLWAWHYANQLGDRSSAEKYIKRLEYIDRNNPVVQSFRAISSTDRILQQTADRKKRSDLHLLLSHEYSTIELKEEALDEAQKAIGQNPDNKKAWSYIAELFEKYNHDPAAGRAHRKYDSLK